MASPARNSAAPGYRVPGALPLLGEPPPFLGRVRAAARRQVALVGALVGELAQQRQNEPAQAPHNSSARNWESTKGVSHTRASRVPRRIPTQTRMESSRMVATSARKTPH